MNAQRFALGALSLSLLALPLRATAQATLTITALADIPPAGEVLPGGESEAFAYLTYEVRGCGSAEAGCVLSIWMPGAVDPVSPLAPVEWQRDGTTGGHWRPIGTIPGDVRIATIATPLARGTIYFRISSLWDGRQAGGFRSADIRLTLTTG